MRDLRAQRARDWTGVAHLFGIDDVLLAAGLSAAGGLLSSSKTSKAAKQAAEASQYAADQTAAVQREALQTAQQNTQTSRAAGDLATNALAARMGLIPRGSTLSTGAGNIYATGAATGATGSATGGQAQAGNIYASGVPYSMSTPAAGSPDWSAYLAAHPDVAASVSGANADQWTGSTPEQKAADHYARYGQAAGWEAPPAVTADQASAATPVTDVQLTSASQVPTYARSPDLAAPGAYTPNIYAPQTQTAPTYTRPDYQPTLDVSLDAYKNSPEYQAALYDINKQSGAAASALAATGGLQSGAAMKRLQEIGQDNQVKYYGNFRDYTTGQYNTDRGRADNIYNFDTSLDSGNKLAYAQLGQQDRQFGAGLDQSDRQFSATTARNDYQYGQGRADNIFNLDRAYGTDLALNNRNYETSRYDQGTSNLFNLSNLGAGAAAQANGAASNYANNTSNALFSNAANQSNAALTGAAQTNNLIGTGLSAIGYALGNRSNATTTTTPKAATNIYAMGGGY